MKSIHNQKLYMHQISSVCKLADHDSRQIQSVCISPDCNLNRFACYECVKIGIHQHQQYDQSHVLDNKELYDVLSEKVSRIQMGQCRNIKQSSKSQTNTLQQIVQIIKNSLKNITKMIEQLEQGLGLNYHGQQLNELLQKLRDKGFNYLDEIQLNMLMEVDKLVDNTYINLSHFSNLIMQNAIRIQEWCYSEQQHSGLLQKIKDFKYKLITQDQVEGDHQILSSTISKDFKYIVSGGQEEKLKIWNYCNNKLIKSIQLNGWVNHIKFTDDSKLLYVGKLGDLYQFYVNSNFKLIYKQNIHSQEIKNIICITNQIILTSWSDKTIIKTDIYLKQQLLLINAHNDKISGLDYDHNLNLIVSSSNDKSIKLWNGNNGQLILQKQNAFNIQCDFIKQVLFIFNKNQLISLDNFRTIIIWDINYETKKLELLNQISDDNIIFNISLVLNQLYITLICEKYIKIYSIKGQYVRQLSHDVEEIFMYNVIQPPSMKAFIIKGASILKICKVELDLY